MRLSDLTLDEVSPIEHAVTTVEWILGMAGETEEAALVAEISDDRARILVATESGIWDCALPKSDAQENRGDLVPWRDVTSPRLRATVSGDDDNLRGAWRFELGRPKATIASDEPTALLAFLKVCLAHSG